MSVVPERYYRPAGTVPYAGTLLMLTLGCGGALLFSFLYGLILMYVPYDKLMFLGTLALGAGVGGMVRGGALAGGVTSRIFVALVALFCGCIAAWFTWTWFLWMWSGWDVRAIILDPVLMFDVLREISIDGIREKSPIGFALQLLWLGEALLIIGCAVGIAVIEYKPYCHGCGKWTQELPAKCALPRAGTAELRADLEEERYEVLDRLAQQEIDGAMHCEVSLVKCPNCDESDYLTVAEIDVTVNKKGEASVQRQEVIRHLHVPEEVVEQVVAISARQQGPSVADLDFGGGAGQEAGAVEEEGA